MRKELDRRPPESIRLQPRSHGVAHSSISNIFIDGLSMAKLALVYRYQLIARRIIQPSRSRQTVVSLKATQGLLNIVAEITVDVGHKITQVAQAGLSAGHAFIIGPGSIGWRCPTASFHSCLLTLSIMSA